MPTNQGNASTTDILQFPAPSKEPGQRSMRVSDAYFARMVPGWSQPSVLTPNQWRAWVASQPVAVDCKETMTSNLSDLDWKITPRKSDQRDELKGTIDYYEKFFRKGGYSGLDWVGFLEWFLADLLDLPFGTAWELGRKGDSPEGRVVWMEPLDGGTLYPTNNKDIPVVQYYNGYYASFPEHAISRAYLNPRTEIERKGWGMAPPEKVFLAMEMLARGDRYYANLLLDVPPAGILDLADITWEDAHTWVESFRTFTQGGVESFKIPVLAEHTGKVGFIPLGKDPNAIMFDRIILKYASLVTAAYGMTINDIGLQGSSASGETLAGSIRSEQKTNRTGKARNKGKIKYFVETILPPTLQFDFIDTDGERLSMLGRARLANATAMNQYREMEAISPEEARLQAIQDGLFTISMPEKPPKEAKKELPQLTPFGKKPPERPGSIGSPQPPSLGGDGEVKKSIASFQPKNLDQTVENIVRILAPNVYEVIDIGDPDPTRRLILKSVFSDEDSLGLNSVLTGLMNRVGDFEFFGLEDELESLLLEQGLNANTDFHIGTLRSRIQQNFPEFLGKAIVYTLTQSDNLLHPANENELADFSDLVEEVKFKVKKSLPDYLSAHVGIELQNIVDEIREQELALPEPIKIRSVPRSVQQPQPINVTVAPASITLPEITVNNPPPEKEDEMQITINNAPPESVEMLKSMSERLEQLNQTVEKDRQPPIVQVNVPQTEIEVNVPKQDAPVINLSQPEINVLVEKQEPPVINVEVNPTPITVENRVVLPAKNKSITIVKDGDTYHGEAKVEE